MKLEPLGQCSLFCSSLQIVLLCGSILLYIWTRTWSSVPLFPLLWITFRTSSVFFDFEYLKSTVWAPLSSPQSGLVVPPLPPLPPLYRPSLALSGQCWGLCGVAWFCWRDGEQSTVPRPHMPALYCPTSSPICLDLLCRLPVSQQMCLSPVCGRICFSPLGQCALVWYTGTVFCPHAVDVPWRDGPAL